MLKRNEKWCIVGGGVLGLQLAHNLSKSGKDISVLEASSNIGGLADAWQIGDIVWDRHYHVTLLSDFHLRNLLEQLDLDKEIVWSTTKTDFFDGESFSELNNALDYLKFPPINLIDKFRLAATIIYCSRITNGLPLESKSVEQWLKKLSGKRTYEKIWLPLLKAKLGENYKHASAAFIWAIVRRLYAARRSGLKTEMFGYVKGGYARIFEKFEQTLKSNGVNCFVNTPVQSIYRENDRLVIETPNGIQQYDKVIVTTAAPVASRLCKDLSTVEKNSLNNVLYQGIVCASVLIKKPLRGAYITYIADDTVPYTAVIEMSALVDNSEFGGNSLVYLPCYVKSDDPLFKESDENIKNKFLTSLLTMYEHVLEDDIIDFKISRVKYVLAISTLDYSSKLPPIKTSVPGLYIANSAHIVNGTLNVDETINLANDVSENLLIAESMEKEPLGV